MLGSKLCQRAMSVITHPLVAVLGATGAGKSKLSLDIGRYLGGEIVSVDSMQIYEGLDIVTNKVTPEEQAICPHHMIGFLSPLKQFTITDFQKMTLKTINDIHKRGKLPILVGGTNYYVESILWDYLVSSPKQVDKIDATMESYREELKLLSNAELYEKLKEADPAAASVIHPNNPRKMIRALEVFHRTGKAITAHWEEQTDQGGSGEWGGPVKFPNACILCVQCHPKVLEKGIYRRVDKMVERGLIQELQDFHTNFNAARLKEDKEANYEHGIFQSIGFKEFHNYLTAPADTSEEQKEKLLAESIADMKLHTWQYAKYQMKTIRKRFVNRKNALPVYKLDATDPAKWDSEVLHPTLKLLKFLYKNQYNIASNLLPYSLKENGILQPIPPDPVVRRGVTLNYCVDCNKYVQEYQWRGHVTSKKHRGMVKKRKQAITATTEVLTEHCAILQTNSRTKPVSEKTLNEDSSSDDDVFGGVFNNSEIQHVS